jgi:hypothetical protein
MLEGRGGEEGERGDSHDSSEPILAAVLREREKKETMGCERSEKNKGRRTEGNTNPGLEDEEDVDTYA